MADRNVVSVVIPTHNRKRYLEECLESVFCQSYGRWEIIVVDDASEDGTREWLAQHQSDRLRYVRLDENSGSTVTRNAGLREAKGDFCMFLDDDDLLPRGALAAHAYALREHTDAIGTVGSLVRFDVSGEISQLRAAVEKTIHDDVWRDVVFWWGFLVGASMFRTSVLREAGGFDESLFFFGDETDLWLRLGHRGSIVLLPDDVIRVRYHGQPRPADFYDTLTEITNRHVQSWSEERQAVAAEILEVRDAHYQVRRHYGEPDGASERTARLLSAAAQCPYLIASPLSGAEIWRAMGPHLPR